MLCSPRPPRHVPELQADAPGTLLSDVTREEGTRGCTQLPSAPISGCSANELTAPPPADLGSNEVADSASTRSSESLADATDGENSDTTQRSRGRCSVALAAHHRERILPG